MKLHAILWSCFQAIFEGTPAILEHVLSSPSQTASSISWQPCGNLASHQLECGRLSVPLDYANPSVGMASLSIMRLLADPETRLGSLFTNPGGPGIQGTGDYMRWRGPEIMEQSGGRYDIVRSLHLSLCTCGIT